jgi:hypothetical protein
MDWTRKVNPVRAFGDKKATHDVSLRLGFPSVGSLNGS